MTRLWSTDTDHGFFLWVNFTFLGSTFVTFSTLSTLSILSCFFWPQPVWTKFWQIKTHCTENSLCVWFKPSLTASRWTWKLRVDTFVLWCPWKGWGANGGQWGPMGGHRELSKRKLLLKWLLTIFTLFWKSFWRSSWQRNCDADFKKILWPGIWI